MNGQYVGRGEQYDCRNSPNARAFIADKTALRRIVEQQNEILGIVPDPTATPEKVREMMRALGVRPEDNIFSCGIIAARNED